MDGHRAEGCSLHGSLHKMVDCSLHMAEGTLHEHRTSPLSVYECILSAGDMLSHS